MFFFTEGCAVEKYRLCPSSPTGGAGESSHCSCLSGRGGGSHRAVSKQVVNSARQAAPGGGIPSPLPLGCQQAASRNIKMIKITWGYKILNSRNHDFSLLAGHCVGVLDHSGVNASPKTIILRGEQACHRVPPWSPRSRSHWRARGVKAVGIPDKLPHTRLRGAT